MREGERERERVRERESDGEEEIERERHWNSIIYEIQLLRDEMNPLI